MCVNCVVTAVNPAKNLAKTERKPTRMLFHHITDWNDAYANGPNIPGGDR